MREVTCIHDSQYHLKIKVAGMKTRGPLLLLLFILISSPNGFTQESDSLNYEDVLKMSLADLMNTRVVSASKSIQMVKDVPAAVRVITAEQIKDRAYFTLEEALADLPDFQFRNIVGFNSYVFMRGASSQNNLILLLVDGIQINELNSGGFYAGGQFILSDVEQIEVVYGPASALYGTNAVSGIINIITKKPDINGGHVRLLGGNFKTGMMNFDIGRYNKSKDFGILVSGQYKTTEKADLRGPEGDNNWTDNMENFENDLSFSAKLKLKKFTAGIIFQEERSSMTTNFKTIGDINLDKNTLWDIMFLNGWVKYTNTDHEKWKFNSTFYYRNSTVLRNTIDQIIMATDSTPGNQIGYYRPNNLIGMENQLDFYPTGRLHFTGGLITEAEILSNSYSITYSGSQDTRPPKPPAPPLLHNYLLSYYLQANLSIVRDFSVIGGIRHDFSSYYGQVFIPRLGVVFNHGKFTAKALYNTAFRSPKPWDYQYGTGNPDLRPEKMKSLELNITWQALKELSFTGSVFNNLISDKLTKETTPTIDRWTNKDKLNTTGFELSGNFNIRKLQLYADYSFNDSRDQDNVFIPEISKHTANAGFTWSLIEKMKINLRANYMGERKNPFLIPATGDYRIDDALIFNGCVSYSLFRYFNLSFKMNNILNARYYNPSNRFNGRYRQPQRTFSLWLIYEFNFKN
jgi:outer membrane receptor for ferrienterochelin and colicins